MSRGRLMLLISQICRQGVSVLRHSNYGMLRHFWATIHFARDRCFPFETSGLNVLDFEDNHLKDDKLKRPRGKVSFALNFSRFNQLPFRENLIPSLSTKVDPQLAMLTKMSTTMDVFHLGGSYELMVRMCNRNVLLVVTVAWLPKRVLLKAALSPKHWVNLLILLLINLLFQSIVIKGCFRVLLLESFIG